VPLHRNVILHRLILNNVSKWFLAKLSQNNNKTRILHMTYQDQQVHVIPFVLWNSLWTFQKLTEPQVYLSEKITKMIKPRLLSVTSYNPNGVNYLSNQSRHKCPLVLCHELYCTYQESGNETWWCWNDIPFDHMDYFLTFYHWLWSTEPSVQSSHIYFKSISWFGF